MPFRYAPDHITVTKIPTIDPGSSWHASPLLVRQNSKHNYVQPERFWPERWEAGGGKDGGGGGRPVGEYGSTMDAVSAHTTVKMA